LKSGNKGQEINQALKVGSGQAWNACVLHPFIIYLREDGEHE